MSPIVKDEKIKVQVEKAQTQVYLDWATEQHQAEQYEAALQTYELIDVKDVKATIKSKQTQIYLEWAVQEKKNGNTQQAESILTNLWNIQEIDQQQALSVGLTDSDLVKSLSRSTGVYA